MKELKYKDELAILDVMKKRYFKGGLSASYSALNRYANRQKNRDIDTVLQLFNNWVKKI